MGQSKTAMVFVNKRKGWKTTFLADEPILCQNGCKDNKHRRVEVIKRGMRYAASYQGQEDVGNVICDVLRLFDGPMCPICGREIYYVYFPTRTESPATVAEPDAEPEQAGSGDRLHYLLVTLALVGVLLLALLAQSGR